MHDSKKHKKKLVVLAHGILKNSKNMKFLEDGIQAEGYSTISVNLPLTFGTLEDSCRSLEKQIASQLDKYKVVHFVGYSMGGLVIQKFLSMSPLKNLGNSVFIATPNKGSKLADVATLFPVVGRVFKPLTDLKTNRKPDDVFKHNKDLKVGVIAGTKNNIIYSKLFMSSNSDGMVETDSAQLDEMHDFTDFHYGHQDIHFKKEVLIAVVDFLKYGAFNK